MTLFRIAIPLAIVLLGAGLTVAGGEQSHGAGVPIIGSGVLVWLAGALLRFSLRDNEERDAEQAARDYYRVHGRWPDEE